MDDLQSSEEVSILSSNHCFNSDGVFLQQAYRKLNKLVFESENPKQEGVVSEFGSGWRPVFPCKSRTTCAYSSVYFLVRLLYCFWQLKISSQVVLVVWRCVICSKLTCWKERERQTFLEQSLQCKRRTSASHSNPYQSFFTFNVQRRRLLPAL
jgi:hypothetical protein